MSIPVIHKILIYKRDTSLDPRMAGFGVHCSCQWEGLAHMRVVADKWASSHAFVQTQRGNEVIIEIDPALDSPKVVDDAKA